jgi:transmembrane sensor
MKEDQAIDHARLGAYIAGTCSGKEQAEVEAWIADSPDRRALVDRLQQTQRLLRAQGEREVAPAASRVEERLANWVRDPQQRSVAVGARLSSSPLPNRFRRWMWPVVGVCSVILAMIIGWQGAIHRTARPPLMLTYTTNNGQRANITLTDGTTIALNVASRLQVPANYPAGNHVLRLDGEALFTVVHHGAHPLTVIAGNATTRVLGTRFVVRHYTTDTATTVVVHDGRVGVHEHVVAANQQAIVQRNGAVRIRPATPAQFSFATGVLTLNDMPLTAAIPELNRWYDADIRLGDPSLANRQITVECAVGSLADLAGILKLMFNGRVVRSGRVLTLYPK